MSDLVEDLYKAFEPLFKHPAGGHDDKSHGNWARGTADGLTTPEKGRLNRYLDHLARRKNRPQGGRVRGADPRSIKSPRRTRQQDSRSVSSYRDLKSKRERQNRESTEYNPDKRRAESRARKIRDRMTGEDIRQRNTRSTRARNRLRRGD